MNTKKILHFSIGPIGSAAIGLITLPVITWFFSPDDIGRLSMLQVTISFVLLIFSLGLDQAYVREFHESNNTPLLLKNTIGVGFLLLSFTLVIFSFQPEKISIWLFNLDDKHLGILILLCLLASFISRFLSLILRMQERGLAFSMSQVLPKVFFLFLISSYVLLDSNFTTLQIIAAHTLSILLVCIIYGWNTRKEILAAIPKKFDNEKILSMLRYSIPLIFGGLAYWGLISVDKVFLRALSSYEELGIYSVAVSFAAVATIFQSIFTTVWAPTVYKWVSSGKNLDKVQQVTNYVLFIVILIFCFVGLFSWVINLILPDAYHNIQYIIAACLGFPLLYTLSETTVVGIGITKKTLFALAASVIALISNLIGNYLLIPHYGAAGAAASTCASFWIFFVCRTEFAILVWQPIPRLALYFFSLMCVMLAIAASLLGESHVVMLMVLWGVLLVFALFIFRDIARQAINFTFT
ncbi:MAG: oligosaccharide flippase family protein [Thiofilum sp.]|uniref:lipopolysaccharide biosynthesis protein n=1 Tax=Thiofilum sp. TaxID=2212733 RepID=UPI0025CF2E55|nr:oligosaccharide flippase family protein [Thiofilum sp.]MBK8453865.1 oligosaccharide flippase family protein [Thiofilum sp.]